MRNVGSCACARSAGLPTSYPASSFPCSSRRLGRRTRRPSGASSAPSSVESPDVCQTGSEELLADGRHRTASEIREELAPRDPRVARALKFVVGLLATQARVVPTTVDGGWRSTRFRYALWRHWLPSVDPWQLEPDPACAELARLYFTAHGPATVQDFRWWSGLSAAQASHAIRSGEIEEGTDGHLFAGERRRPPAPLVVRLLPIFDTALLTHADRSRIVDDDRLPFVYDRGGNATSVIVVDGRAAGVWHLGCGRRYR
ncbi:MAG TPA: crosslink repair DNA glycosylase YcaQ family protein [Actinomycetota bacterium]|nr:crosslink repair DNA glycosylase YcaQ family protein [Actinomycetota bacterium]